MPYPSFLKPSAPSGTAVVPAGFDLSYIDVYRALTRFMEEWQAKFKAAQAAITAAPPGPNRDNAEALCDMLAHGLFTFWPVERLEQDLAGVYAALAGHSLSPGAAADLAKGIARTFDP